MQPASPIRVVITDTNVLINLMHVGQLGLLGALHSFEFIVPDEVVREITVTAQQRQLEVALTRRELRQESITAPNELTAYTELRRIMGRGEAACLALAEARGWMIASDEKRRFQREAIARLGQGRLITTAGLFILVIQAGVLSIEEADQAKEALERKRFRMKFRSFRELIGPDE